MSKNSLINVTAASCEPLKNVKFSTSSISDNNEPRQSTFTIDGVDIMIGQLVLIKDNNSHYNGVYTLKKLDRKGFVLTKKASLEKKTTASVYVQEGNVNKGLLYSLVRKTKNKSFLDFELIQAHENYPVDSLIDDTCKTECELSIDTLNLLEDKNVTVTEEVFNSRLMRLVSTKEKLGNKEYYEQGTLRDCNDELIDDTVIINEESLVNDTFVIKEEEEPKTVDEVKPFLSLDKNIVEEPKYNPSISFTKNIDQIVTESQKIIDDIKISDPSIDKTILNTTVTKLDHFINKLDTILLLIEEHSTRLIDQEKQISEVINKLQNVKLAL